jgi:fumarate reductase subunit D
MKDLAISPNEKELQLLRAVAHIHRISGVIIATFLPLHFLSLGLALNEPSFSAFIAWSETPLVKYCEAILVLALAVHFAGGIRLLVVEFFGMTNLNSMWIAIAFMAALGFCGLFLLNAFG